MDEELKKLIEQKRAAGVPEDVIQRSLAVREARLQQQPKGNIITRNLPAIGAIGAGLVAAPLTGGMSLLPALGVAAGAGAAGAAAGSYVKQGLTKKKLDTSELLKEAGSGAVGGAVGQGAGIAFKAASKLLGKGVAAAGSRASNAVLKATPSSTRIAAESGKDLQQIYAKYSSVLGNNYDDMLGNVAKKGKGGQLGILLDDAENVIKTTSKQAGSNIRLSGDDIIKALKSEAKSLSRSLGDASRRKALDAVIKETGKKYSKGVTVNQALSTLRQANSNFGKSILDTAGDAVAKSAQKVEANVLRTQLKKMFPDIADALDTQAELLTLRPVLAAARAASKSGKFALGKIDVTRPGTMVDAALNQPQVATKIVQAATKNVGPYGVPVKQTSKINQFMADKNAIPTTIGQMLAGPKDQTQLPTDINQVELPTESTDQTNIQDAFTEAIMQDLQTTGGKNISAIEKIEERLGVGGGKVSAKQQEGLQKISTAENLLNSYEQQLSQIGLGSGIGGRIGGAAKSIAGSLGLNPEVKAYNDVATGTLSMLIKSLGEVGTLSDTDKKLAMKMIPKPTDTAEEVSIKIGELRKILTANRQGITSLPQSSTLPTDITSIEF
jgi:hypothetical protein